LSALVVLHSRSTWPASSCRVPQVTGEQAVLTACTTPNPRRRRARRNTVKTEWLSMIPDEQGSGCLRPGVVTTSGWRNGLERVGAVAVGGPELLRGSRRPVDGDARRATPLIRHQSPARVLNVQRVPEGTREL
jgi:hypothetical protein